jgi:hypothetical protein
MIGIFPNTFDLAAGTLSVLLFLFNPIINLNALCHKALKKVQVYSQFLVQDRMEFGVTGIGRSLSSASAAPNANQPTGTPALPSRPKEIY